MTVALRAPAVWTGSEQRFIEDGVVVIDGRDIAAVGPYSELRDGLPAAVVDLPDHALCPGLVDAHSHVGIHTLGDEHAQLSRSRAEVVLRAAEWLRRDLQAGVTTMRTVGDRDFMDITFRQLQAEGVVEAPRLVVAGNLLRSSLVDVSVAEHVCNGPDALRAHLRESVRRGADWVKLYATPFSKAPDPVMPAFSREEIAVIVDEARRAARPVAVHCHGGKTADWCIELGVDSIEHGLFLTPGQLDAMAERGIPVVCTTGVVLLQRPAALTPIIERNRHQAGTYLSEVRKRGVTCVPGTDAVHGELAFEIETMIRSGWTPSDALAAATLGAAKLLRLDDRIGTLAVGKRADIVAFRGRPWEDPGALRQVGLVVQDGRLVHAGGDLMSALGPLARKTEAPAADR